jgi:hypothetical protein
MNRISELEERMAYLLDGIRQEKNESKRKIDTLTDEAKRIRDELFEEKKKMIADLIEVGHCYKYNGLGSTTQNNTTTYMKVLENNGKSIIVNQISKKYDKNGVLVLYMLSNDFKIQISTLANYSLDYKREIGFTEISEEEFNKIILK